MEQISFKPVIKNNKIISIEIENVSLPLRSPLAIDDLTHLVKALETFVQYVDVQKLGSINSQETSASEWSEKTLHDFMLDELSDNQTQVLRILAESKEITREKLVDKLKEQLKDDNFSGWDLGGLLRSITVKSRNNGYPSLYEKEWKVVGNDYKCFYRLTKDAYRKVIQAASEEKTK
jgi:hypothetical protein